MYPVKYSRVFLYTGGKCSYICKGQNLKCLDIYTTDHNIVGRLLVISAPATL